jgi:hypothetical protein
MIQPARLLIAIAVLASLAGLIWWSNKKAEDAAKNPASELKHPKLISLLEANVVEVTVTRKDGPTLKLVKDQPANTWRMVSEPQYPADNTSAMTLVTSASTLPTESLVEENAADLIQYGLDPPQFTLELKDKTGKTEKVLVGDATPVGAYHYAMKPSEKKVYTIARHLREGFDKTANDIRDKRMLTSEEATTQKAELIRPSETIEFTRGAEGWRLSKPQPYRTDNLAVDELVRKVRAARFDPLLSEEDQKKYAAAFVASPVLATVRLTDAKGAQQLEIRKSKDNAVLMKSSAIAGVYKAEDDLGSGVEKGLNDFRSKKLFDFGFDPPSKIEVRNGDEVSVLEHKGEDWLLGGKKMDPPTVHPFVDALRGLQALNFVKPGSFTTPKTTITVTSQDGKTVEKVMVAEAGNFRYVKREGAIDEFEVDPSALTELLAALKNIKPAGAAPAKK